MNKIINKYTDKLLDIANHYNDFTTSDLQGAIEATVMSMYQETAASELLAACKYAAELVKRARKYFPKSIKNSDRFSLELTCAEINKAIFMVEGGDK